MSVSSIVPRLLSRLRPRRPARPAALPASMRSLAADHQHWLHERGLTPEAFASHRIEMPPRAASPPPARTPARTAVRPKPRRRRQCLSCKQKLAGRQQKYCSDTCGKRHRRRQQQKRRARPT